MRGRVGTRERGGGDTGVNLVRIEGVVCQQILADSGMPPEGCKMEGSAAFDVNNAGEGATLEEHPGFRSENIRSLEVRTSGV